MSRKHSSPQSNPFTFQNIIFFLFNFLLFTTPFVFTWVNEELFEFNKMLFVYAMTILIGGVWVFRMISYRQVIFRRTIFDLPILLFLISQLLATIFSIHPATSIFGYYTRFHGGLLSTLTYILLFYAAVSNLERKHLAGMFLSLFSAAAVVSLLAIPEHFGHSFSCVMINTNQELIQKSPDVWHPSTLWQNYNVKCWIQDVQNRVFATFGQPNWLAAYAITLLPLSITLAAIEKQTSTKKRQWKKWFYLLVSVLLFLTLIFTKSRSGFLGLWASVAVMIGGFYWLWRNGSDQKKSTALPIFSLRMVVITLASFVVCGLMFGTAYPPFPNLGERILNGTPQVTSPAPTTVVNRLEEGGTESGEIRQIVWTGALKVWQRYPLFGSGVETFAYSYYLDRPMAHNLVSEWDFLYNKAHNEWLNYLATTGIVGLTSYLVLLFAFIGAPLILILLPADRWPTKKLSRDLLPEQTLPILQTTADQCVFVALSAGVIALTISNFFGFSTVMVGVLLFLYPAFFVLLTRQDEAQKEPSYMELDIVQLIGYLLVALMMLWLLLAVRSTWLADKYFAAGKSYNQIGEISSALQLLREAERLSPNEGVFKEELAITYAKAAVAVAEQTKDATIAGQLAKQAVDTSDEVVRNNPVHLNFYKSKVRVLLTLAPLNDHFLWQAKETLIAARKLAPTDPKLLFNQAVIELSLNQTDEALKNLQTTVEMKPNYEAARMILAEEYERRQELEKAREQYRYILEKIQPNNEQAKGRLGALTSPGKPATGSAKTAPKK